MNCARNVVRGFVVVTSTIIVLAAAHVTWASDLNGFLREPGHGDVAFSFTSESYDHFWAGQTRTEAPPLGKVSNRSLSLWFAYGLTDRWTLTGDFPYVHTSGDGFADFDERDLQDFTLLLEARIATVGERVRSDFIGAFGARAPMVGYAANTPVSVGDGTGDWLLRFVYLLRFHGFYFSQQIGYDLRGRDAPDGLPLYSEAGQTWGPVTVSAFYSRYFANSGTDIGDPGFTFPSNKEEYGRVGGKVYGRVIDNLGLAAYYFTTVSGRNTGDSSGVAASVVLSF